MDYITGELGDIGEMVRLSGGPRWRGTEQGQGKGFMICEKGKLPCLEKETEMGNRGISYEEFTIKGGILGFGGG